jgi:hypothetical protein
MGEEVVVDVKGLIDRLRSGKASPCRTGFAYVAVAPGYAALHF